MLKSGFFPIRYFLILFLTVVLSENSSLAQIPQIKFRHFTINQGLSQNTVLSLLEDKDGIIWIGTEDGLNKFDGYDFNYYQHDFRNDNSIPNNKVNALLEDRDGRIWIGTANGLSVYDKKKHLFTTLQTSGSEVLSYESITSLCQDKQGSVWLTSGKGLKRYDRRTRTFEQFRNLSGDKADRVTADSKGRLWVSINKDLKLFDPLKKRFLPLPAALEMSELRKAHVRVISEDFSGNIWIGTEQSGLFVYNPQTQDVKHMYAGASVDNLSSNIVREICFPDKQTVWIGTRDGLNLYERSSGQIKTFKHDKYDETSLSQNSIRAMIKDRAGNIWVGTFSGGLNQYNPGNSMFGYLGESSANKAGLSNKMVTSIASDKDGRIWIGTEGGGLNYYLPESGYVRSLPPLSPIVEVNTIRSIKPEGKNLWIGTANGLYLFNAQSTSLHKVFIPNNNREVTSIVMTGDRLWLGTNGSGLIRRDPNGSIVTFYAGKQPGRGIASNSITHIVKDKTNNLWIGTSRGLNYFNGKQFWQYMHDKANVYSLSSSAVSTLLIDSKERLWVGTKGGGLNLFDKKGNRFYVIDKSLGLANNVIHAIEEDSKGNLWVSTNRGLAKISISGAPPFSRTSVKVSNYFVEEGLQSNQFLRNSSFKDKNGALYFGGINGLTSFYPSQIERNNYRPRVIITDFLIRNKPVELSANSPVKEDINYVEEIKLPYNQAFISFKFAALNYFNAAKNQYAYKLEGLDYDEDWHYIGNRRLVTFNSLEAGTYIFRVKAANNDGIWGPTSKSIKIVILPPWWLTWWAFLLYGLVIAGALYVYFIYSLRTAELKKDLEFEHLIREKDQELYQRKLNFFTYISHEIKTPLTLILGPLDKLSDLSIDSERAHYHLGLMRANGQRLLKLISQLLDFRRFESGNMELIPSEHNIVAFVNEVTSTFEAYAESLNIKLIVESEKTVIKAWCDKDKFEKILYNLLSNAIKFTRPEGEVRVVIRELFEKNNESGYVMLEVRDTGIGIPADKIDLIFEPFKYYNEDGSNTNGSGIGLAFVKGLVELHQGEITVQSTPEEPGKPSGTCFFVKIPLGNAHFKKANIALKETDDNIKEYLVNDNPGLEKILESRTEKILAGFDDHPIMLVVEDNKDVLLFLKAHFESRFQVHAASDGQQGIEKAISILPDIIISDVMMPQVSGTLLCSTLKTDDRTSHIPIILLTAREGVPDQMDGLKRGADDYVTKPFNIGLLEVRVWNLLEQRQQLRARYRKEITLQPANLTITAPDEAFLEKVMNHIEENISEPELNVEELADKVFMNRTTLYRKIKSLTGQTAVEFIRTVRLKRAAQLLKTNSYHVNEVAYMTGFTDLGYFRRCFKEQFKETPTDYMNNSKNQQEAAS